MGTPAVTHILRNQSKSRASYLNTNFTNLVNAMGDGTSDWDVGSLDINNTHSFTARSSIGGYVVFSGSTTFTENSGAKSISIANIHNIYWNPAAASGNITLTLTSPTEGQEIIIACLLNTAPHSVVLSAGSDPANGETITNTNAKRFRYVNSKWWVMRTDA